MRVWQVRLREGWCVEARMVQPDAKLQRVAQAGITHLHHLGCVGGMQHIIARGATVPSRVRGRAETFSPLLP